jgi:hypothetical protein
MEILNRGRMKGIMVCSRKNEQKDFGVKAERLKS